VTVIIASNGNGNGKENKRQETTAMQSE